MSGSLAPDILAAIDRALTEVEPSFPGVSKDPKVRADVEAAVSAAISSLAQAIPDATEADTRTAMPADASLAGDSTDGNSWQAVYESGEATKMAEHVFDAVEATRQAIINMGSAAVG